MCSCKWLHVIQEVRRGGMFGIVDRHPSHHICGSGMTNHARKKLRSGKESALSAQGVPHDRDNTRGRIGLTAGKVTSFHHGSYGRGAFLLAMLQPLHTVFKYFVGNYHIKNVFSIIVVIIRVGGVPALHHILVITLHYASNTQ